MSTDLSKLTDPEELNETPLSASPTDAAPLAHPIDSDVHNAGELSLPRFLHIVEQGAFLRKTGTRLRVIKAEQVLLEASMVKLQSSGEKVASPPIKANGGFR